MNTDPNIYKKLSNNKNAMIQKRNFPKHDSKEKILPN